MNIKEELLEILEMCMEISNVSADVSAETPSVFVYIFKEDKVVKNFVLCTDSKSVLFKEKDILNCRRYLKKLLKERK